MKAGLIFSMWVLLMFAMSDRAAGVPLPGDFDGDADVDLADWAVFKTGWSGPNVPTPSYEADFDADGDVDLFDGQTFVSVYTGPFKSATGTASVLTLSLIPTSPTTVGPGGTVSYEIRGELSGGPNAGLALWGVDLETSFAIAAGLPQTSPGPQMGSFARPAGMANPAGYGGTSDGLSALRQIGGGQNTVGDNGSMGGWPNGAVVEGIGLSGPVVLASGILSAPAGDGAYQVAIDNAFASVLAGGGGFYWPVALADSTIAQTSFDITVVPEPAGIVLLTAAISVLPRLRRKASRLGPAVRQPLDLAGAGRIGKGKVRS